MTTTTPSARVDISQFSGKETLMRLLRQEYGHTLEMLVAAGEEDLGKQTPCEAWRVRDLAGHLVDVAFSYNGYFRQQRNGYPQAEPLGMRVYARALEKSALLYLGSGKWELLSRMDSQVDTLFRTFDALTEQEWAGLLIPHKYVGPVPAFMMATFQLMDYSVHNWDFEMALGHEARVDDESAETLVPYMFGLWQLCFEPERAGDASMTVGVEITSGPQPDHWTVTIENGTFAYVPGKALEPGATFRFAARDFCLDAYQREQRGEAHGDPAVIEKFRSLFFTV
ncbi:MAG: maleylpyruvate isomerase family mycothiol-dependent enzyme [Haloechinothrix sp.]